MHWNMLLFPQCEDAVVRPERHAVHSSGGYGHCVAEGGRHVAIAGVLGAPGADIYGCGLSNAERSEQEGDGSAGRTVVFKLFLILGAIGGWDGGLQAPG